MNQRRQGCADRRGKPVPAGGLGQQLPFALGREPVEARLALVFSNPVSAAIRPSLSNRCSDGYSDPYPTCSTSTERLSIAWAIACPCARSVRSVCAGPALFRWSDGDPIQGNHMLRAIHVEVVVREHQLRGLHSGCVRNEIHGDQATCARRHQVGR